MNGPVTLAGDGYEGVTVAGVLVVARDSGAMLLAQRAEDKNDDPEVAQTWEMPGGHLNPGEDPFAGASREFEEELGLALPPGEVVHGWRAGDEDHYQGFVYAVDEQFAVDPATADPAEVQNVAWVTPQQAGTLALRPEFAKNDLAALVETVSGNPDKGDEMTEQATEPEWDALSLTLTPIPVHGVLAPEEIETGDGRGFNAGSMTRRPLRLPFSDQKVAIGGHDGSVVVGSVDRLMRKDGLIHWEGSLMPSADTDDLVGRMQFFDGRFGVSVDGDSGSLDTDRAKASGVMWFERVRASGLTAVAIPAFHEAYVGFGHHPDMPDDDTDAVLSASGFTYGDDIVGGRMTFDRGPGWVSHPKETRRIHAYWTQKGQPGYAKIGWGTPGDFNRAKALIGAKIAANSPEDMRFLNQIIAQWHFDALGYWPGDHARMEKAKAASGGIEMNGDSWETVLTSSAGGRVLVPAAYFDRHPDTGATVIEDPDENGIRRTYGYAAEWGVCHIGINGRCVEPPRPADDTFPEFHLGRTKTDQGYLSTGVLTFLVEHRDAERILSETAEQSHFDNVANAWAAIRLGIDERGIWFSGYVLPGISDEDCTLIEATGQVSGEWKYGALRALQSVNTPGYPVLRSSAAFDDDGNVVALVAVTTGKDAAMVASANGVTESECYENSPRAKMAALAAVDAEVRMDRLRSKWASKNGEVA